VADHTPNNGSTVLLTRLSRQVYRRVTDEQLGMKLKSFVALNHMRDIGPISQQTLAEHLCIDANTLVLILNDLESLGYAERRRDPSDRRRHIVESTPAGLAALARAEAHIASIEDDMLGGLSADERAALQELLARALESATRSTDVAEAL
jgi:DNA-binding MarR family transcriptional regulator